MTQPYTYTGREYDSETGLYYYRSRYYDAKIGRFLREDPIWDTNRYAYVYSNPLNLVDPYGLRGVGLIYGFNGPNINLYINSLTHTTVSVSIDIINEACFSIIHPIKWGKQTGNNFTEVVWVYGPKMPEYTKLSIKATIEIAATYFGFEPYNIPEMTKIKTPISPAKKDK